MTTKWTRLTDCTCATVPDRLCSFASRFVKLVPDLLRKVRRGSFFDNLLVASLDRTVSSVVEKSVTASASAADTGNTGERFDVLEEGEVVAVRVRENLDLDVCRRKGTVVSLSQMSRGRGKAYVGAS